MKNIACIIARTNSSRLPKKVLKEIGGVKMIEYIIRKIKKAKLVDEIYLCTSKTEEDKVLLQIAKENGVKGYAGSLESIIDRMLEVGHIENADNVIRITGDNVFTDEIYLDLMLKYHQKNQAEYTRVENLPVGITAEVMNLNALQRCYSMMSPDESQYLMLYMFQPSKFKCQVLIPPEKHSRPEMTFTVDTPADFERTKKLIEAYPSKLINLEDILNYCEKNELKDVIYKSSGIVKFPASLEFTFKAFRIEMNERLDASNKVYLQKDEYK
jgi:spore coat polysaccharide biosynthesis protein SpsF